MTDEHDARLAKVLEEVGYPPSVVAQAKRGHWSDFKTSLAFPKLDLHTMLLQDGHHELASRVRDGEFDG